MATLPKLLAIVGPTASGKSELANQIALSTEPEIICADSRTIYKHMDIGTAKPTQVEREKVPHWGLDLINPGEVYSAKLYQQYAKEKIAEVQARHHLPLIVGGTGLYIDTVLYNFEFTNEDTVYSREDLNRLSLEELQNLIELHSYPLPKNFKNKRHLIRTIERRGAIGSRNELMKGVIIIGLLPAEQKLKGNISSRAESMFNQGVISETQMLIDEFGRDAVLSTGGIVYKICIQIIDGEINERQGQELFEKADWQYARRQRTWFKKNPDIKWFSNKDEAILHLSKMLNT